jgi:predicted Ser/Thr protein kinase
MLPMHDVALQATQSMPFSIGTVLAERYELRALLGEGGMGAVFRAYDRELDENVALKLLHGGMAGDAATLLRFRREVKLARRVTHRNVARTFDLGLEAGVRFLTMELIEGKSLAAHVTAGAITLPEALRVSAEIARGLAAAHVVGVVHRDLKPDNVMLSQDRVVITDFGIARVADGGADVMRTGMVVGTPAYMAPEQLENGAIDGRTDVYALGIILFELLAGRPPFKGDSAMSIAALRLTADAPDVRSVDASIPDAVAALVHDMLGRRREDRLDAQRVLDRVDALRGNAGAVPSAARIPVLTNESVVGLGQPRTVAVEALAGSSELAPILTQAIADALTEARLANVGSSEHGKAMADLVVQGSIHTSGDRVRVRLRVLGQRGTPVWAGHADGDTHDSLDLEDRVVGLVEDAVRMRTARDPGPANASLRADYEKARAALMSFGLPNARTGIGILEAIEAKAPGDPRVRSLLARGLISQFMQTGGRDRVLLARAEDFALRALQDDPSLSQAQHVIATVRIEGGELLAGLRAEEECLRHDPRNAGAHASIGELLCESLFVSEGRRRLDLAGRLEPSGTFLARIKVAALLDERARAQAILDEITAKGGEIGAVVAMTRIAIWWDDRAMAAHSADVIEKTKAGASWDAASEVLRSYVSGDLSPDAPKNFATLTSSDVSPRHRSMLHEIAADYFARMGQAELAIEHIVKAAQLPFTNLLWMTTSPPLALVRADPRFAEARATTAARVAGLWGSVGPWPNE